MSEEMELIQRIKTALSQEKITETTIYGGQGFSIKGRVFCGVANNTLFLFIGEDRFDEILTHPLARPFEVEGKPLPGWVQIVPTGIKRDSDLAGWLNNALNAIKEV